MPKYLPIMHKHTHLIRTSYLFAMIKKINAPDIAQFSHNLFLEKTVKMLPTNSGGKFGAFLCPHPPPTQLLGESTNFAWGYS